MITAFAGLLLIRDSTLGSLDGWLLIGAFLAVMAWSIYSGLKIGSDNLASDVSLALEHHMTLTRSLVYLVLGLFVLVVSSRILVWGGTR